MTTDAQFGRGQRVSRRAALRGGLAGATSLSLWNQWGIPVRATPETAKARAVIQIWLWGGASHLDTFDPKPHAGYDFCGPLTEVQQTSVPGIQIGQLLPTLATQADKFVLIRSMTHGINAHETASYMVQTGHPSGGMVFPSVGAVVSRLTGVDAGYTGLIPPYIVVTEPQGRFSEAGFMGARYRPFATGGDPRLPRFVVEGVVAEGISDRRQRERRDLLQSLDSFSPAVRSDSALQAHQQAETEAYDLILGDSGKVFDLSGEQEGLRDEYGRSTFGQSCLLARRLVERGVRYITINYKGWDTHKQHFQAMRRLLPELDRGLGTLLRDLADHGMLDSTIVWCSGEFGRTPQVQWEPPWNGGRGHWGRVFSTLLAGGGFRGGQVVGGSDAKGLDVAQRPVYPWDLIASMYRQLGIAPDATLPHPQGLTVLATPTAPEGFPAGAILDEIL